MKTSTRPYAQPFLLFSQSITEFIQEVEKQKLQNRATDAWTVKDVLCHIAYWHTYYAQNYAALAAGKKPFVFKSRGGSTRNQDGVNSLTHLSKTVLLKQIHDAQESLYKSIVIKEVSKMNYTDRREYDTTVFLDEIARHIQRHTLQVKQAK